MSVGIVELRIFFMWGGGTRRFLLGQGVGCCTSTLLCSGIFFVLLYTRLSLLSRDCYAIGSFVNVVVALDAIGVWFPEKAPEGLSTLLQPVVDLSTSW